jgi:hypothetical protein
MIARSVRLGRVRFRLLLLLGVLVPVTWMTSAPAGANVPVSFQTLPDATVGVAYASQISFSDSSGGPYSFSFVPGSGTVPEGLAISASGEVSGTPVEQANAPVQSLFTVEVQDPGSTSANGYVRAQVTVTPPNWTPPPPIQITTTSVPAAKVAQSYSETIQATGGVPPYTWSLQGTLPQGFSFSNGTISGTTTQVGSFKFTVTAADVTLGRDQFVESGDQPASQAYTLTVTSGVGQLDPIIGNIQATVGSVQSVVGGLTSQVTGLVANLSGLLQPGCLQAFLSTLLNGTPPSC